MTLERMTHEETDAQVLNSIDSESTNPDSGDLPERLSHY